jgi:hypothetical protein
MHDSLLGLNFTTNRPHRRASSRVGFTLLLLLVAALWHAPARAFCDSFHPVPEFYVGDTNPASPTYDAACTHNDIQSAITAATCSYGTKIFITHEHQYTNQSLSVVDKNVSLIGRANADVCGPASVVICNPVCAPPPTGPLAIINGANGASVITINGTSHVTLQYLDITNVGHNANGNGGGVDFDGSGSLTIDTSWVGNNHATNGGGIYFNGTGATTSTLNVLAHSDIFGNTADGNGGGILVSGNSELDILQDDTEINANTAGNHGGGIAIIGPAKANIGSPGITGPDGNIGLVNNNTAAYGGGISVTVVDSSDHTSYVNLFTTDATRPVGIVGNTATHTGGGIYLKPAESDGDTVSDTYLCAWDYRIEANNAQEGAAIYSDTDYSFLDSPRGGAVSLGLCPFSYPSELGAVACPDSNVCNRIDSNHAEDNAANPTSAILIQTNGYLNASRFSMRYNNVAHVIRLVGDSTDSSLFDCLIAENTSHQELFHVSGNASPLSIGACTLANNSIGTTHVIHTESDLTLTNDIIDEGGTLALDYSGDPAKLSISYVLSNDVTTLPDSAGPGIALGTPDYVDIAHSDYHLKPTSLGVDYAPNVGGTDLDRHTRDVDLPSVGNVFGHQDLGAYELQNGFRECGTPEPDEIYCDGFNH